MVVHTKFLYTLVDIRSQRSDTHRPAFVHEFGDFLDVILAPAHDGSHELSGIVGLEIGRLEGHP